jgi:pilus assembly protein CpaB
VRPQSIMVITLALIFGGSAAVGVNNLVKDRAAPAAETVPVLVALVDLPRGGMITADMVKVRDFPKGAALAGTLTKPEEAVDRTVSVPILKDEPVLDSKLSPRGSGRGMAALVPKGMRAFTIQTPNIATGVAGFILPGNKVDVLLNVKDGSNDNETGGGVTTTLLQQVEILAVDQRTDAPADNKVDPKELRSVTLVVTPEQAKLLDLGQNKGTLHLALRNPEDTTVDSSKPVTALNLRYRQEKPWDERAKSFLEALGKVVAQRKPDPPPPPPAPEVVAKAPEPPPRLFIRTIRGPQEGGTFIYPPGTVPTLR